MASILGLVVLSWTPAQHMVRTQVLSGAQEHWLSYLLTGLVLAAAWRGARVAAPAVILMSLAALLEVGQHFVGGRHAAVADFSASAFGAASGIALAFTISIVADFRANDAARRRPE